MLRIMIKYAWLYVGTFYSWGGDDPSGFDCSGFIVELLKAMGFLTRRADKTAHGLYLWSRNKDQLVEDPYAGCIAYYWNVAETTVIHTELCINSTHTIGASGGYSKTKTRADAIKHNAFIKVRPINYARGMVTFADPFKEVI